MDSFHSLMQVRRGMMLLRAGATVDLQTSSSVILVCFAQCSQHSGT